MLCVVPCVMPMPSGVVSCCVVHAYRIYHHAMSHRRVPSRHTSCCITSRYAMSRHATSHHASRSRIVSCCIASHAASHRIASHHVVPCRVSSEHCALWCGVVWCGVMQCGVECRAVSYRVAFCILHFAFASIALFCLAYTSQSPIDRLIYRGVSCHAISCCVGPCLQTSPRTPPACHVPTRTN